MLRSWATVVLWQDGVATLRPEVKTACKGCPVRQSCGSAIMSSHQSDRQLTEIACTTPLQPGQRVELGIKERSLLGPALLIYLMPLVGLFLFAGLLQAIFHQDIATIIGAFTGIASGFFVAKKCSLVTDNGRELQPVILDITPTSDLSG